MPAFAHMVLECARRGVQVEDWAPSGLSHVPCLRNLFAARAMAENFSHVLFADDDVSFRAEDVLRWIELDRPIIAAIQQKRNRRWSDPAALAWRIRDDHKIAYDETNGLMAEDVAPTAFRLIKTEVFHKMREASAALKLDDAIDAMAGVLNSGKSAFQSVGTDEIRAALAAVQKAGWTLRPEGAVRPFTYAALPTGHQEFIATYFEYDLEPAPPMSDEWIKAKERGIEDPWIWQLEDHNFCRKAAKLGFQTYIDIRTGLVHWEGRLAHDETIMSMMRARAAQFEQANGEASTSGVAEPPAP
jgi:hypothetical protein